MESPHFNTSSVQDKWHRWKSRSTSKGSFVSSIATIRIGCPLVGTFHGMLSHQIFIFEDSTQMKYRSDKKDDEFIFPIADGTANLSGKRLRIIPSTHSKAGINRKDWRSQWGNFIQGESGESQPAEPTDDAEARADFWSIQGDFIYRHHNEPRVQLHVPKEETITISTEGHWWYEACSNRSGCVTRKTYWRLLECRFKQTLVRFVERSPKIYSEGEASKGVNVVWEETDKDSNDSQTRSCMARSFDEKW